MQTFDLLGLPSLAFERVIKQMETAKVIELTIASKIFKSRVERFKLGASLLKWEYPYSIHINSNRDWVVINFFPQHDGEVRKINGTLVRITSDYRNHLLNVTQACESSTWLTVMEDVTIHLLSIFRVKNFNFELRTKMYTPDIRSIFIWKYCRKFNVFDISDHKTPQISLEEMAFLKRNIEAETLHIAKLNTDFQFKETFNCKQLELSMPLWATPECFNSDHYTKIQMHLYTKRYFFNVDGVLDNWMQGGHEKLERFYARVILIENAWSASRKLEEMEHTPSSFLKHELQFRSRYWHPTKICVDIRRPIDGRLATLMMDDHRVLLLVWHEKHFKFVSEETKIKLRKLKLINE